MWIGANCPPPRRRMGAAFVRHDTGLGRKTMRNFVVVAIAVGVLAGPVAAQNIGDVGRMLQEQVLPRQGPDPRQQERDRAIYEQGRRDSERGSDQRRYEDRRRDEQRGDARRREDSDRYRGDQDRRRADEERARAEEQRARTGRY